MSFGIAEMQLLEVIIGQDLTPAHLTSFNSLDNFKISFKFQTGNQSGVLLCNYIKLNDPLMGRLITQNLPSQISSFLVLCTSSLTDLVRRNKKEEI